MKVYFDTNILVAAMQFGHIHHQNSFAAYERVRSGELEGYLSAHAIVEFYSVFTRAPLRAPAIQTGEVLAIIQESILPHFQIIDVTTQTHLAAITRCANSNWRGGRIHDAVHIQAAAQAKCDALYTYNLTDFHNLAPEWASRIQNPPPAY